MTLAILFSLKSMETLENGLQIPILEHHRRVVPALMLRLGVNGSKQAFLRKSNRKFSDSVKVKGLGFVYSESKATSLPDGYHRESNAMFTLSIDKDQIKHRFHFHSNIIKP